MRAFFLYGPPGSGKTTLGELLAERLRIPFADLDRCVAEAAGTSIPEIFARGGEGEFRRLERLALERLANDPHAERVVALGGGTLLDPACRALAEASGTVVCLAADGAVLAGRIAAQGRTRPLADSGESVARLLADREDHYASFPLRLDTTDWNPGRLLPRAEILFGAFRLEGDGWRSACDVRVGDGLFADLGGAMRARGFGERVLVACDSNTGKLFADRAASALKLHGFDVSFVHVEAGEKAKTLASVGKIWKAMAAAGIERNDAVVAVGGGVTGDLAGFAAACWKRGVPWVAVPTSLLAMTDAAVGGKTGCDLPDAKNAIGAFHPPRLVLADVRALATLSDAEWANGLAETVKHGLIADPPLAELARAFARGVSGTPSVSPTALALFVSRSLAVKVGVVREDPFERGARAKLNLGHTAGHALEVATGFSVRHGEAVAIGAVAEAALAERAGLAAAGWSTRVAGLFAAAGLPVEIPAPFDFRALVPFMAQDKKRAGGRTVFALPCGPGDVRVTSVAEVP